MQLAYRFNARFVDSIQLGRVDGGRRVDNYFDGEITEGPLAGARVRGVDQVRIRDDGSAQLDIRETIETPSGTIGADVRGYALPHPTDPDLHRITGFALFGTAVPEYADYNTAVVAIEGMVDMAAGTIDVYGRAIESAAAQIA